MPLQVQMLIRQAVPMLLESTGHDSYLGPGGFRHCGVLSGLALVVAPFETDRNLLAVASNMQ